MNIEDLVELAKQVCHNVDLELPNKELWSALLTEIYSMSDIPLGQRRNVHSVSWVVAQLEREPWKADFGPI